MKRSLVRAFAIFATSCFWTFPNLAGAQLFTEVGPGLPAMSRPAIVWGDYDGDGYLDVLVAGPGKQDASVTTIYKNNAGTFSDSGVVVVPLQFAAAAWGDFDGDGDLDLAMTGLTTAGVPTTKVYRNNGGTFSAITGPFVGVYAGTVNWADYDGDGDLDLLVTGTMTSGQFGTPATRLYRNDGNGQFVLVSHPFPDVYLGAVAWCDYDKDGDLDVVITGTSGNGGLSANLWRNDGKDNFTDSGVNLPGMDLGFAAWGDYDNDGNPDLLFGGNSNEGWITRIYRNNGGSLADASAGLLGVLWASAVWGDYDNDGDLDIMLMGYDGDAQVRVSRLYRNDQGTFVDSGQVFHNLFLGTVSWMDYDKDGDLDISIAGNTGTVGTDFFGFYRNNTLVSNTPPTSPSNLTVVVNGTSAAFSWVAANDAQTPVAGLTYNLRVGTTPGGSQVCSAQSTSTGRRLLSTVGNAGQNLSAKICRLQPGTNYSWSVQAVDSAFEGSPFAAEGSFVALPDVPSKGTIVRDLSGTVHITWIGTPGYSYQIESSGNLSSWATYSNLVAAPTSGVFEISVSPTPATPTQFYRAMRP